MDLTLDKAVPISTASELSKLQLKELEGGICSARVSNLMRHVDVIKKQIEGGKSKSADQWLACTDQRFVRDCSRCGRYHLERRCPAFARNCLQCGMKGHFVS